MLGRSWMSADQHLRGGTTCMRDSQQKVQGVALNGRVPPKPRAGHPSNCGLGNHGSTHVLAFLMRMYVYIIYAPRRVMKYF